MPRRTRQTEDGDDDPLASIANLFDLSVAFIVALLIALTSLMSMQGLFDASANVTVVKRNADGSMEIITREQNRVRVQKVTNDAMSGRGTRLGTAYRLTDGQVVYVPDSTP